MMSLNKTLIMSECLVNQLIDHQKSKYLDKRDINDFFYIAGPYLINNNHWVAFIVDMIRYKIILLDPMLVLSPLEDKALQSWVKYYNSRTTYNTSLNQSNAIRKYIMFNIQFKLIIIIVVFLLFISLKNI